MILKILNTERWILTHSGEPISGEHVSGEPVSGEHVSGEHVLGEHVSGEHGGSCCCVFSDRMNTLSRIGGVSCDCSLGVSNTLWCKFVISK